MIHVHTVFHASKPTVSPVMLKEQFVKQDQNLRALQKHIGGSISPESPPKAATVLSTVSAVSCGGTSGLMPENTKEWPVAGLTADCSAQPGSTA